MRTTRVNFEVVKYPIKKSGICPVCNKKASRTFTESQTLNPFNTDAAGNAKTRRQILDELIARSKVWKTEPTYHTDCQPRKGATP
jgi:hypothetical protein